MVLDNLVVGFQGSHGREDRVEYVGRQYGYFNVNLLRRSLVIKGFKSHLVVQNIGSFSMKEK